MRRAVRLATVISAIVLIGLQGVPARGATEGTVILRLTLRGTVPATDSFSVALNATNSTITGLGGFFCGPATNPYTEQGPVCVAGATYESRSELPTGTELSYTIARYANYAGTSAGAEILFDGTVTFNDGRQVLSFVYDYSLGALPNTAVTAAGED